MQIKSKFFLRNFRPCRSVNSVIYEIPIHECHTARITPFSHSSIIHEEKTKQVTTVKKAWIRDPSYHKIR